MQLYLSFLILFTANAPGLLTGPGCLQQIDFFIGEWNLVTRDLQSDGSFVQGQAISTAYHILDRKAIQDDFRSLNSNGKVIFRGTSIRSCLEDTTGYVIAWIMPGKEGYTDLRARWKDGILAGEGEGYDDYGSFRERFTYFNITDSSYSFRMHRSYDQGQTWLTNFSSIEATRKR